MAFGGLTTSCSASNLGTLTRIPSTDQRLNAAAAGVTISRTLSADEYDAGTLRRIPYGETRVRSPQQSEEYDDGTLNKNSSIERYNVVSKLSRIPYTEKYSTISTITTTNETRKNDPIGSPSTGRDVAAISATEFNQLERIPSEQRIGTLTRIHHDRPNLGTLARTEQLNTLNRIAMSEHHNPSSLRDPNTR